MTYTCPACGGPNENNAGTRLINCIWCGTAFRIPVGSNLTAQAGSGSNSGSEAESPKESPAADPSLVASQASLSASQSASAGAAAAASSTAMASSIIQAAQDPNLANDPEKAAEIAAAAARAAANAIAAANAANAAATAAAAAFDLQQKEAALQNETAARPIATAGPAQPASAPAVQSGAAATRSEAAPTQFTQTPSSRTGIAAQTRSIPAGKETAQAQPTQPAAQPTAGQPVPAPETSRPAASTAPVHPATASTGSQPATPPTSSQPTNTTPAAQPSAQTAGIRIVPRKFADAQSGITLASAAIPENFTVSGSLVQKWQSDMVPFTASIQAASPDRSIFLASTSGEFYSYYLNPLLRSAAASVPGAFKTQLRNFMEPDEYLHEYATKMAGVRLQPTARAKLPSAFGADLQGERNRLARFFQDHSINIGVQIAVSTYYCDAFLYRYEAVVKGPRTVFLAGCDYKGVEYYDASNSMAFALGGGLGGLLAMGMQSGSSKKAKAAAKAAAAGKGKDSPTGVGSEGIPFGHGKEYGKRVDTIDWGADRLYFMAAPIELEKTATNLFLRFIGSLTPDPALWKRRNLLIEQMYQQRIVEATQLNAQATQMRIDAQRRQADLARQIQANSDEISRGIMDSWEKRTASQSRMSENWSQAIRGVNTWQTSSGRTVEASVTADHVYQNRYGDTIEVSGTALDDELTSRLDWTELRRK